MNILSVIKNHTPNMVNDLLENKNPLINQLSFLINEETKRFAPNLWSDIINLILVRGNEFSIIPKFVKNYNLYGNYQQVINTLNAIKDPYLNIALIQYYDKNNIRRPSQLRSLLESSIQSMVDENIWNQYHVYKTLTNDSNVTFLMELIENNQKNITIRI